jgi:hypothetical protein
MKHFYRDPKTVLGFLAALGLCLVLPGLAHAQSTTTVQQASDLAGILNNGGNESENALHPILSVVSYLLGAMLAISAMFKFKAASENQVPIMDPIMRLLGACLLIGVGWFANSIITSLGLDGTVTAYTQPALTGGGGGGGLDSVMVAFVSNIYTPAKWAVQAVCWVGGIAFIIVGLKRLAQAGEAQGRAPKMSGTIGCIIAGACMISLGQLMNAVTSSLFGSATQATFSAVAMPQGMGAASTAANSVFAALFAFVEIIGWVAFARGVFLLKKLAEGEGQKTHLHAFVHIIAGAIAVNLAGFVKILQSTVNETWIS